MSTSKTHPRVVLVRAGWALTALLRFLLLAGHRPDDLRHLAFAKARRQALRTAITGCVAFEGHHTGASPRGQAAHFNRIRVGQELDCAFASYSQQSWGISHSGCLDLLERAEDAFGAKDGPFKVETPDLVTPLTETEQVIVRVLLATTIIIGTGLAVVLGAGHLGGWGQGPVAAGVASAIACLVVRQWSKPVVPKP